MKYFKVPDLGEGLQEAEIVTWFVKPGDRVLSDQLILSLETAKAIVEIPSPQDGIVAQLFGREGDIIHIGEALLEFEGEEDVDNATVVGKVESKQNTMAQRESFIIGSSNKK